MLGFLFILFGILVMVAGIVMAVLFVAGPARPMGPSVDDPKPADAIVWVGIAFGGVGLIVWGAFF